MSTVARLDYKEIYIIAQRFRTELEHAENPPVYMKPFPQGWCGAVSRALGGYLLRAGIYPIEYVCGYKAQISHAWIEVGNYIIDITADQFDDCDKRIILTTDRTYHNSFSDISRRPICLQDSDQYPENWIVTAASFNKGTLYNVLQGG